MAVMLPDGFAGAVMAAESVEDFRCLLSGPAGCRNRYTLLSSQLRRTYEDPERFKVPYFKGRPRVPCTYADEEDFINGGGPKVADALSVIKGVCDDYVAVVDSPGTALIGDDHARAIAEAGMTGRAVALTRNLSSDAYSEGYDLTLESIVRFLAPEKRDAEPMTVNILGLPMTERDWFHGLEHLRSLLASMGVRVNAAIGAEASSEQIRNAGAAEANLVVHPEFGIRTARFLERELGTPFMACAEGAPVGADASEAWLRSAAGMLGADPSPAVARIDSARREIASAIGRNRGADRRLEGMAFSASCIPSTAYPLACWLEGFLGMVPASVSTHDPCPGIEEVLRARLDRTGQSDVLNAEPPMYCGVVLTNGHEALRMEEAHRCACGIGVEFPFMEETSLLPNHILGAEGSLWIAERILNSLG